jgi:3-phenylpropionate/trans-cinnamate dioxygenase ferredoxin reductase subunit
VHPSAWYGEQAIDLRTGTRVVRLQPGAHEVELDTGERLPYTKLLLATGSYPRKLDVEGANLTGVTYLRRLGDSDRLRSALTEGANVVVIGAGWIGLEVAAAAREHGCAVTVVEQDTLPLRRVLGDEVAGIFADLHRAHGVDLRFFSGVKEFGGIGGHLTHVVLDDDTTELPADVVVVGVGIRPAVELAEVAGLEVDNGVVTDQSLRTSDPDVFACGDVASSHNPLVGKRIRVEHWSNALNGGKAAAKAMLGQAVVYDRVPYFYTDQFDLGMEYSGFVEPGGYDSVVFRGDPSLVDGKAPECIAFWLAGDRVLAGMNVNIWDVTDQIQALVRAGYAGRGVDVGALADPAVPLDDLLT